MKLIAIFILTAVCASAHGSTSLQEALENARVVRVGKPLEHYALRRDQGATALYQANTNVGEVTGVRCHFGTSFAMSNKGFDEVFQDKKGRSATRTKWIGIEEIPGIKPMYFWQTLVLNPALLLKVVSKPRSTLQPIRPCLEWKSDIDYGDGTWHSICEKYGEIDHYNYTLFWTMTPTGDTNLQYESVCEKSGSETGAEITVEEFNSATNEAFVL